MIRPGRVGFALALALTVGLIAAAARVDRWVGGGRSPQLIFDVTTPVPVTGAASDPIAAAWRARFGDRDLPIAIGPDPTRSVVTVAGRAAQAAGAAQTLTRPGKLAFLEVASDTAVARAWYQASRGLDLGADVAVIADMWSDDRTGEQFNDYVLTGPTPAAIDAAIATLARGTPLPDDLRVMYEEIISDPSVGPRPSYWRSYLVHTTVLIDRSDIARASVTYDQNTLRPEVLIRFTPRGAQRFGDATAAMVGHKLAMALDGVVVSAPVVRDAIRGGVSTITMGGADAKKMEAEAAALVNSLRPGAELPAGIEATLREALPGVAGTPWLGPLAAALLAGLAGFVGAGRLGRTTVGLPAAPVAPGTRGLVGTVVGAALTIGLPLALIWLAQSDHVVLPGVNSVELGAITGPGGTLGESRARMSIFALGVMPVISAFWIIEAIAAISRRWRRVRLGTARGRAGLDRGALLLGLGLAALQAYFVVDFLASASRSGGSLFVGGDRAMALVALTLVAGVAVHVAVADLITRHGLCNGYLALLGVGAARAFYDQLAHAPRVGDDARLALAACLALLALVTVVVTTLRDTTPARTRQPWPVLVAMVALGQAIGVVVLAITGLAALAGKPPNIGWLVRWAIRPAWFDVLVTLAALALIVRWYRLAVTRLAAIAAAALIVTVFAIRAWAPASVGVDARLLPMMYVILVAVEVGLAVRARLGLRRAVAILAVHDVDRADRAADALAAAGIPASVESLRLRAILRGLGSFAPIVIRVAADDAGRATATLAEAEAEHDPHVAAFAG